MRYYLNIIHLKHIYNIYIYILYNIYMYIIYNVFGVSFYMGWKLSSLTSQNFIDWMLFRSKDIGEFHMSHPQVLTEQ